MNIFSYIREAIFTLFQNKMRSFLSLLGIVIGIASVVVLTAIGDGLKQKVIASVSSTQNVIGIEKGSIKKWTQIAWIQQYKPEEDVPSIADQIGAEKIFTPESAQMLQSVFADDVKAVVPIINFQTSWPISIEGNREEKYFSAKVVSDAFFQARNVKMNRGRLFDSWENAGLAVIGNKIVSEFNGKDPIGKTIFMNNTAFRVIGILEKTDDFTVDNSVFVPYDFVKPRFSLKDIQRLEVYVKDVRKMHELQKNIGYFLMRYAGGETPDDLQFNLQTNELMIKESLKMINQLSVFISSIAGISLLVWWIGIMNIMLVSVTERTREIGIRKAIGARRKDIILQFLTESAILSLFGGVLAVIFSYIIVGIISLLIVEFTPMISVTSILVATTFSVAMGVLFGLLPAWKAAKMTVIDALRFE